MNKEKVVIIAGGAFSFKYPQWVHLLKERSYKILSIDDNNSNINDIMTLYRSANADFINNIEEFALLSPENLIGILNQIKIWGDKYEICAAISIIESFVTPIAWICEKLNLPGCGMKAAMICRDKMLQRNFLPEFSPGFTATTKKKLREEYKVDYPFVIKPTTRSGSSGVQLISNNEELKYCLNQYAEDECLLLEDFIQGNEYSVESAVIDGKVKVVNITEQTNGEKTAQFVEMGHTVPAINLSDSLKKKLININQTIIEKLSFKNGITHGEFKIDNNNNIYLMEMAARGAGDMILFLFHLSTERSFEDLAISIALNETINSNISYHRCAKQVFISPTSGFLGDVTLTESDKPVLFLKDGKCRAPGLPEYDTNHENNLIEVVIGKLRGSMMAPDVSESKGRLGYFVVTSENATDIHPFAERIRQSINIIHGPPLA